MGCLARHLRVRTLALRVDLPRQDARIAIPLFKISSALLVAFDRQPQIPARLVLGRSRTAQVHLVLRPGRPRFLRWCVRSPERRGLSPFRSSLWTYRAHCVPQPSLCPGEMGTVPGLLTHPLTEFGTPGVTISTEVLFRAGPACHGASGDEEACRNARARRRESLTASPRSTEIALASPVKACIILSG